MNDLGTFFAMGGYAAFIWPAYALAAAIMAAMAVLTLRSLQVRRREERDLAAAGVHRRGPRGGQS